MPKNISLLIKPASSSCNLGCKYCFYYDVASHRDFKNYGFMSHEVTESLIKKTLESTSHHVTFAFQGGEPTLIGLDYFRDFVALVKQYQTTQTIHYAIQTNGTQLDDAFCSFFHDHHFLVGLSMDGPKEAHDLNRLDTHKKGTFKSVDHAAKLLTKHLVDFNILSVVTKNTVRHTQKIYRYFRSKNYNFLQFIPCISDFEDATLKPYNITAEDYGQFLIQLFDLWYQDLLDGNQVSIRLFDNYVQMLLGIPPESCDMNGFCSVNPVVEADGSVYPCDFYVLDTWKLGHIVTDDFENMLQSSVAKEFVTSSQHLCNDCKACPYIQLCRSGCRRHKEMYADTQNASDIRNTPLDKNYFCTAYRLFFDHSFTKLQHIARLVSR